MSQWPIHLRVVSLIYPLHPFSLALYYFEPNHFIYKGSKDIEMLSLDEKFTISPSNSSR